ncbi:hypothetical protein B0H66DRAFT_622667 [Apodospora peruviana]|uniref:C2H2-type domain-containing protein n=1 Tax=Apodospora peruviana TaxID=516989 RepID=A0AAE0I4S5_9PEZI|nr:hypothetical protein B0H66DRAFT_622667 [Apodospora peruviana]
MTSPAAANGSLDYFSCGSCDGIFRASWKARDAHCLAFGHEKPPFECARCPLRIRYQSAAEKHMEVTNRWHYVCLYCEISWRTEEQCEEHEAEDHSLGAIANFSGELTSTAVDKKQTTKGGPLHHERESVTVGHGPSYPFYLKLFRDAEVFSGHVESGGCLCSQFRSKQQMYSSLRLKDPYNVLTNPTGYVLKKVENREQTGRDLPRAAISAPSPPRLTKENRKNHDPKKQIMGAQQGPIVKQERLEPEEKEKMEMKQVKSMWKDRIYRDPGAISAPEVTFTLL